MAAAEGGADELLARAKDAHKTGDVAAAEAGYRQVLKQAPRNAEGLHLLGVLLVEAHTCAGAPGAATEGVCGKCVQARRSHAAQQRPSPAADVATVAAQQTANGDHSHGNGNSMQGDSSSAHCNGNGVPLSRSPAAHVGSVPPPAHKEPVILDLLKVEEGLRCIRAAINAQPSNARFRRSLGVALQRAGLLEAAVEAFEFATEKDPADVHSWLHLARALKQLNRRARAAEAYAAVARLQPSHPTAHYSAALCLRQVGRRADAVAAFRRHLELCPDHREAKFWIAALTGDAAAVATAPPDLVAGLFDSYADNFDAHLVDQLAYRTPWLLMAALQEAVKGSPAGRCRPLPWHRVVDLGCGTGLMGPLLAPHLATPRGVLEGVDLSSNMVAKAQARGCYQRLHVDDLVTYLRGCKHALGAARNVPAAASQQDVSFDTLVAADVFVYIGDLQPVLAAAADCAAPGALFGFSTEAADHSGSEQHAVGHANQAVLENSSVQLVESVATPGQGYVLTPTGRFAHTQHYLQAVLEVTGWQLASLQHTVIRHNAGKPVHGYLVVAVRALH